MKISLLILLFLSGCSHLRDLENTLKRYGDERREVRTQKLRDRVQEEAKEDRCCLHRGSDGACLHEVYMGCPEGFDHVEADKDKIQYESIGFDET